MLRQKSVTINLEANYGLPYYNSPLWAAGFSFSDSSVISTVPYSCHLPYLFFGEEILMTSR
jgi:hypothetical protein